MEADTASLQSLKTETRPAAGLGRINLTLLIIATFLDPRTISDNPHQPMNLTWMILSASTEEVINSTSAIHPQNTWWPDLEFDLCLLAAGSWDMGEWEVKTSGSLNVGLALIGVILDPPLAQGLGAATSSNEQACGKHPSMCAPEEGGTRRPTINAGVLMSFIVPIGDASQRGQSIGSPLFVGT